MTQQQPAISVKDCIRFIRERLGGAVAVAKAAEACVEAGDVGRAITIMLDVEQPLYEATMLLNAVILLHRCADWEHRRPLHGLAFGHKRPTSREG